MTQTAMPPMETPAAGGGTSWGLRLLKLATYPETVIVLLLPVALVVSARLSPQFGDLHYLMDSSSLYMETGIMALAMTFIIISGNIDLSVASNLCLTAVICARMYHAGVPMAVAVCLAPVIGGILGLFNGLLIATWRLPSLTVTLGTMALFRGLAQVLAGVKPIGNLPEWFVGINDRRLGGLVPLPMVIFLVLAMALGLVLGKTTLGRRVFALGTNEAAARFAGIRTTRLKLLLFFASGAFAGLASMIMLSRLQSASYTMAGEGAEGNELAVITAVVLGGADIAGGRGSIFGSVVALLLLGIVSRGMGLAYVPSDKQLAITGTLLVLAVILFRLLRSLAGGRKD